MKETKVSLVITTSSLSLSDLSSKIRLSHTGGSHDRGSPRPGGKGLWDTTVWRLDSAEPPPAHVNEHCQNIASQLPPQALFQPGILPGDAKLYLDIAVFFSDAMYTLNLPSECLEVAKSYKAEIQVTCYPGG